VKDLVSGDLTRVSTSDTGVQNNRDSLSPGGRALSADGTRVAFYSVATNLDPADTDRTVDAYVKDVSTGDIALATTSDTGVKANAPSGPIRCRPTASESRLGPRPPTSILPIPTA
jgi:hypothetical protein